MNNFYEVAVRATITDEEAGKIKVETLKVLVEDVGVEAAIITCNKKLIPNLDQPTIRKVSITDITTILNQDGGENAYKAKVAYITDHPTKDGKTKTIFEYMIVYADSSTHADTLLRNHLSNVMVLGHFRVDSISMIKLYDIITREEDDQKETNE